MGGSAPLDEVALTEEYLGPSCYGRQLGRYLEIFPASACSSSMLPSSERTRPQPLPRLFDHIGVDPEFHDPTFDHEHYVSAERRTVRGPIMNVARSRFVRPLTDRVPSHLKLRFGRSAVASRTVSASEVHSARGRDGAHRVGRAAGRRHHDLPFAGRTDRRELVGVIRRRDDVLLIAHEATRTGAPRIAVEITAACTRRARGFVWSSAGMGPSARISKPRCPI